MNPMNDTAPAPTRGEPDAPHTNDSPPRNPWLCVMVAGMLGVGGLSGLAGIIACAILEKPVPSELTMMAIACVSSLPGFLTVVPRGSVGYASLPLKR